MKQSGKSWRWKNVYVLNSSSSLLAEALFLVFADRRQETSAMGRKWLSFNLRSHSWTALLKAHALRVVHWLQLEPVAGLKVNDQLVAYATRFSAVHLKNHVWSYHCALQAKVQCDFSSAYFPDHSTCNFLRLINIIISIRYNITRHKIRKSHHFSFIGLCSIHHLEA